MFIRLTLNDDQQTAINISILHLISYRSAGGQNAGTIVNLVSAGGNQPTAYTVTETIAQMDKLVEQALLDD